MKSFFSLHGCPWRLWRERIPSGTIARAADSVQTPFYKNKVLIFPLVALSTETSWVFGFNAYIFKTSKKDPNLSLDECLRFLYTLDSQILIGLGAYIFLPKEKYVLRFENSFSKFPDKFWGIGNDTPESAKEATHYPFTSTRASAEILEESFPRHWI